MAEGHGGPSGWRAASSWPSQSARPNATWSGWAPSRAKYGALGTQGGHGSRPVVWRRCPRSPNGPFRRDRTRITCAGSRAIPSRRNDSGLQSKPARSCQRSMAAAHGTTAYRQDRTTPTRSRFTRRLRIPCASRPAMVTSRVTMRAPHGVRREPVWKSATCAVWRSIRITGGRRGLGVFRTVLCVHRRPVRWKAV